MVLSASTKTTATIRWSQRDIDVVAERLASAKRCVVFTGAGVSKASGIPTYRDALGCGNGLWDDAGMLLFGTPLGFLFSPREAWRHYCERLLLPIARAKPNEAHDALAALERSLDDVRIVTQNVDGLHQRAGSADVVELHGSVATHRHGWLGTPVALAGPPDPLRPPALFARPNVVLFFESIPLVTWLEAEDLVDALEEGDVLLVVGTSCAVAPANTLPRAAYVRGATIVEVNPRPALGHLDALPLAGDAGPILSRIVEATRALRNRPR